MSHHRVTEGKPLFPDLPAGWREERIHDVAELRTSNIDKKSEEGEVPVRLCNYVDVYKNDRITASIDFMEATASEAQIDRFSLKVGDVLITKDSETPDDIGIPTVVSEIVPGLVCGYHLTILRPDRSQITGNYLYYALSAHGSAFQFYLAANGVTRFGLTYEGTKNVRITFPALREQEQIALFLDWKTRRINQLISRKKLLLEKLKENRISIITKAVTKGLDPVASMQDSNIPWLGHVPSHWKVKKFSYIAQVVRGASPRPAGDPTYFNGDNLPWITVGEITKDEAIYLTSTNTMLTADGVSNSRIMKSGTLVLTNSGATLGVPKILSITGCANDGVVAFENLATDANKLFLFYYLSSLTENLRERMKQGGGQPNLNTDIIKALSIPFPPLAEQTEIANHLSREVFKSDQMASKTKEAITRLTEYRSALITAAVTGKIDVRDVKIPTNV